MRNKGVMAAKVLSCIIAAVIIINSTQTACASSQAAFDMSIEEEQILLEEAVSSEEESEIYEEASDDANISWDDEIGVSQEEEVIILEEAEDTEENGSVILDDQEMILEEEILDKLGEAELEAAEEIILTEEDIEVKNSLVQNDVLADLLEMEEGEDYVEDQIIALASGNEEAELIARAYGGELIDFSYGVATISLKDCELTVVEAFQYGINPDVSVPAVEPDYLLSFDDYEEEASEDEDYADFESWENQYYNIGHNDPLFNPASSGYQWFHEAIGCFEAWDVSLGSNDITVAVIDSGVQTNHDDLKDAIVDNYEQVNEDTAAIGMNDSNDDGYGHGTHVAGLVAATIGNGKGGAGVAPGVKILPINVCSSTETSKPQVAYMIKAIQYVAGAVDVNKTTYYTQRRADIINMSIGSNTYNAAMKAAVDAAYSQGVTFIAAMGNDGANLVKYPARYDHVIGVCATRKDNSLAEFSDYGEWADISAPGLDIYSSTMGNSYGSKKGTSMASPIVAGACALYMSYMGHVTPDSMEAALKATATKTSQPYTGAGVVNVARLLGKKPAEQRPNSPYTPIKTITLDKTLVTLSSPAAGTSEVTEIDIVSLINENQEEVLGKDILNYTSFKWTSSNEAVAKVVGSGEGRALTSAVVLPVSPGKATITCQVLDRGGVKAVCEVRVVSDSAITGIRLESNSDNTYITRDKTGQVKSVVLYNGANTSEEETLSDDEIIIIAEDNEKRSDVVLFASQRTKDGDFDDYIKAPIFKSSNPKVVRIEQVGDSGKTIRIKALSKGSAKITATATDGSKKSTSVTIKVKQLVTSLKVSGQRYVIPGSKATYKSQVYPLNADNKKVEWTVGEDVGGNKLKEIPGISISGSGVVKVDKNIDYKGTVYVKAISLDNNNASDIFAFTLSSKTQFVTLENSNNIASNSWNTLGVGNVGQFKSTLTLVGAAYSSDSSVGRQVSFTSSNPKIVDIVNIDFDSSSGKTTATLQAKKKGKATIMCKALDGSNKSKKVSIKVVAPVSGLSLSIEDNLPNRVTYGSTVQAKATIGKVYGTPNNSKIIWDYDIVGYRNGSYERLSIENPQLLKSIKKTGSFYTFSKGKVKVNSRDKFKKLIDKYGYDGATQIYTDFGIIVTADTVDGSGLRAESGVIKVIEPCSKLDFYPYIPKGTPKDKEYVLSEEKTEKLVIDIANNLNNLVIVKIDSDSAVFGATSYPIKTYCSNTNVASCYYGNTSGHTGLIIYPYMVGNCDVSVTLKDGSGFTRVLRLEVINSASNQ